MRHERARRCRAGAACYTVAMTRLRFALALTAALLAIPPAAFANDPASSRAASISAQTMSPFCEGRTLATCTSPAAAAWRSDIRTWTEQGVSSEEIRRRLEARAGGDLGATPRGWALYALLGLLGLGSTAVLVRVGRRLTLRQPESDQPPRDAAARDELDDALDAELAELDATP